MTDPTSIPTGEFVVDGQAVVVARAASGAVTVKAVTGRWLGVLATNGRHQGARGYRILQVLAGEQPGAIAQVVRCVDCRRPLTDKQSRTNGRGSWCQHLTGALA